MDSILYILIFDVVGLLFAFLLLAMGSRLFKMRSLRQTLDDYRANPDNATWFEKYFLGFRFSTITWEWTLKAFGDRFISLWYRFAGLFFMIFGVFFIVGLAVLTISEL